MKKAYTHVVNVKYLYLDINMFAVKAFYIVQVKYTLKTSLVLL